MPTVLVHCAIAGAFLLPAAAVNAQGAPIQPHFDLANFPTPLRIDNPYSGFKAGTRTVFHELEDGECKVNDVVVTDNAKHDFHGNYAGLSARAVTDRVYDDAQCNGTRGLLLEDTTDWYGQDKRGNVWYFGEATVEYTYDKNGQRIDADTEGSWVAGERDAKAGIVMYANPVVGQYYRQEYEPGVAEDAASVRRVGISVGTGLGGFTGCVETRETTALSPGDVEYKQYCRNIGLVRVISPTVNGGAELVTLAQY